MVKIGLFSDIHADLVALQRALAFLRDQGCDVLLCAGDLVEKGADGDQVVALIRDQAIPCVRGNHDDYAADNQRWLQENANLEHPNMRGRLLSAETLVFLESLPQTLSFNFENRSMLMAHGAPWHLEDYIFPFSQPPIFKRLQTVAQADVVILGHTHQPMRVDYQGMVILNPGSVCGDGGSSTVAILSLPDLHYEVYSLKTLLPVNFERARL